MHFPHATHAMQNFHAEFFLKSLPRKSQVLFSLSQDKTLTRPSHACKADDPTPFFWVRRTDHSHTNYKDKICMSLSKFLRLVKVQHAIWKMLRQVHILRWATPIQPLNRKTTTNGGITIEMTRCTHASVS